MKPSFPLYIHTIRAISPDGENKKISFLAKSRYSAVKYYISVNHNVDFSNWSLKASRPTCDGNNITEVHCLRYGSKFKAVHKGGKSQDFDNDEYYVKSPLLTKCDYNPINRSYLCVDGEGHRHYIDAYEWCITNDTQN